MGNFKVVGKIVRPTLFHRSKIRHMEIRKASIGLFSAQRRGTPKVRGQAQYSWYNGTGFEALKQFSDTKLFTDATKTMYRGKDWKPHRSRQRERIITVEKTQKRHRFGRSGEQFELFDPPNVLRGPNFRWRAFGFQKCDRID
eukprot:24391-Rhodomonas_salina.1